VALLQLKGYGAVHHPTTGVVALDQWDPGGGAAYRCGYLEPGTCDDGIARLWDQAGVPILRTWWVLEAGRAPAEPPDWPPLVDLGLGPSRP
jgi:hypothetical protein